VLLVEGLRHVARLRIKSIHDADPAPDKPLNRIRTNGSKPADPMTINQDVLAKHGIRPDPKPAIAVECLVDDNSLECFAVPRDGYHLVVIALVMLIAAWSEVRKGRELRRRTILFWAA